MAIKNGGYTHAKLDAKLARRRADAESRQVKYDSLTLEQRLKRASGHPGESNREIARINAQIVKRDEKVKQPVVVVATDKKVEKKPRKNNKA